MNKKEWLATALSWIGLIIGILALSPQDWVDNLISWGGALIQIAIIALSAALSFFVYRKLFGKGNILAFSNRNNPKQKNLFEKELLVTKNITGIGIACNEIARRHYEFWESFFIERDGKLRLMFLDPNGEQIKKREEEFRRISNARWSNSIKPNLDILLGNIKKIKIDHELYNSMRYEIGVYEFPPSINCIITDNYIFVHHYGSCTPGVEMPIYVIRKGENKNNNPICNFYISMLRDECWGKSVEYKEN